MNKQRGLTYYDFPDGDYIGSGCILGCAITFVVVIFAISLIIYICTNG